MVRIHVRVRIFGPGMWALICLGLMNTSAGPKAMVPTRVASCVGINQIPKLEHFSYVQRQRKKTLEESKVVESVDSGGSNEADKKYSLGLKRNT